MLNAFSWVIPRRLNFIFRRFGTLCLFHLYIRVSMKNSSYLPAYEDGTECSETSAYKIQTPGNYPQESTKSKIFKWKIYVVFANSTIRVLVKFWNETLKFRRLCKYFNFSFLIFYEILCNCASYCVSKNSRNWLLSVPVGLQKTRHTLSRCLIRSYRI